MKKRVVAGIAALLLLCCAGCAGQDTGGQGNVSTSDQGGEYGPTFVDKAAKFAANTGTEVIGQIGDTPYYIMQEYDTELYGVFCEDTFDYSVAPTYRKLTVVDDPDYIPAKNQDGYYGFIDCNGNTAIDFFYSVVEPFYNGYAPAQMEGAGWGVIDKSGNVKIDFAFQGVDLTENGILCCTGSNISGDRFYCLYNYDFNCVVSADPLNLKEYYGNLCGYTSFEFISDYVFAKRILSDTSDEIEAYDVFYANGSDEPVLTREYISQITNLNFEEWYCRILGEDRFAIAVKDHGIINNDGRSYFITDGQFNVICSTPFAYIGKPYSSNKLLANTTEKCSDNLFLNKSAWCIIDMDGNIIRTLPKLSEDVMPNGKLYVSLNDDFAYAYGYHGAPINKLYNYNTDTWSEWGSVNMLDGTQCIIVSSNSSGLFGIIDHGEQVLDCLYSDAVFENGTITLTRGSQQETYTPQS